MLDRAKAGKYAIPAINVTSSQTLSAALQGFADAESDGIIQVSNGGAAYWSGSSRADRVKGSLALSAYAYTVADLYPGIALQAIIGTLVVVAVAVGLHMSGAVRTTSKGNKIVLTILIAAFVYGIVNIILVSTNAVDGMFGLDSMKVGGIPLGIILGLLLIFIGGYMLIGDLELVHYAVANGAPKKFAWMTAFGIVSTVIFIYWQVLRILAVLAGDR